MRHWECRHEQAQRQDCKDELLTGIQLPVHHDTGYKEENCKQENPCGTVMRETVTGHLPTFEAVLN
jgi:hypothetical protein